MPSAIFRQGQALGLLARGRTRYLNLRPPNDSNCARGTYVHSTYPPHRHTHTYVHGPCALPSGCVFTAMPASQPFPSQKLPALTKTRKFILTLEFFSPSVLKARLIPVGFLSPSPPFDYAEQRGDCLGITGNTVYQGRCWGPLGPLWVFLFFEVSPLGQSSSRGPGEVPVQRDTRNRVEMPGRVCRTW